MHRRSFISTLLNFGEVGRANAFRHFLQVNEVGVVKVSVQPVLVLLSFLQFLVLNCVVELVQIASSLFCHLAEVQVGNVALVASVQVLEHLINLVHLVSDPHRVQASLEFGELHSVVEVLVEVSIGLRQAFVLLLDFDPQEVEHPLDEPSLSRLVRVLLLGVGTHHHEQVR